MSAASANPPPYFLVACDMDGTFLNNEHRIGDGNRAAVQRLLQQATPTGPANPHGVSSVSFALASGRHHKDLEPFLRQLDLPPHNSFIVSSNGARAHRLERSAATGTVELVEVFAKTLPPATVAGLLTALATENDKNEININLYQGDRWRCSLNWEEELQYSKHSGFVYETFSPAALVAAHEAYVAGGSQGCDPLADVSKVYYGTDNLPRLKEIAAGLEATYNASGRDAGEHIVITSSSPYIREITAAGVTKVSGLTALLPLLQTQYERISGRPGGAPWRLDEVCVAFGDSYNDEAMLAAVAHGCLMANAAQKFKDVMAEYNKTPGRGGKRVELIQWTNDEDGVGKKIEEIFDLSAQ